MSAARQEAETQKRRRSSVGDRPTRAKPTPAAQPTPATRKTNGRPARPDVSRRVAIEDIVPQVDAGRFAVKRIEGDPLVVEAAVFADGHDSVACALRLR